MTLNQKLRALVADRVARLRALQVSTVQSLPNVVSEDIAAGKTKLHQYHDVLNSGEHMVVVQAMEDRWFGIFTAIEVDGFVVTTDGMKRSLREEEKWDFI